MAWESIRDGWRLFRKNQSQIDIQNDEYWEAIEMGIGKIEPIQNSLLGNNAYIVKANQMIGDKIEHSKNSLLIEQYWPLMLFALFLLNIIVFMFIFKKSSMEKKYEIFFKRALKKLRKKIKIEKKTFG